MSAAGLCLLATVAASGCAHTVIIDTEPPGAQVYVDGKLAGEAPVVTTQRTGFSGHITVRVEAESFQTEEMQVPRSEWFLWPAIISVAPLFGIPFVVIPFVGPIITIGWAVLSSPTLIALAFVQKYPDRVTVTLKPRSGQGFLQPTDTWLIPEDLSPNPPPLPPPSPEDLPFSPPPQPDGANPVP